MLDYEEFVKNCRDRHDAQTNDIVMQFLERYKDHPYNESGHFRQAYYATSLFFRVNPRAKDIIRAMPLDQPVDLTKHPELLEDWRYFLSQYRGEHSDIFGYDLTVLYRGLHQNLGGRLDGGGAPGIL